MKPNARPAIGDAPRILPTFGDISPSVPNHFAQGLMSR